MEIAYAQPRYALPQAEDLPAAPGSTPLFVDRQGYLEVANSRDAPASNGIDARYAWTHSGGRGDGLCIIDVEFDWRDGHEDLPAVFYSSGQRTGRLADRNHGTAVLGVLRAEENAFGATGIVPNSNIGFSAAIVRRCFLSCIDFYDVADAINRALPQLVYGDLLLIEQQVAGPTDTLTCDQTCGNCSQFGFLPVEYNQAEYDAIRSATINGRIVVEAAGNGQMNLDDARYNRRFDPSFRDSGAILVGAGTSSARSPQCWSNAGDRLDVQGWGDGVTTLGYGDLFGMSQGLPETRWYTLGFSGTSSATPIVTGAAAAAQGVRRQRGLLMLNSTRMRDLLRQTGVPQDSGRQVGPLPNLKDAIALYVDPAYQGFPLGTPAEPYSRLADALTIAWSDAQIKMAPGIYGVSGGTIAQPVTLMSRGGDVTIGRQ